MPRRSSPQSPTLGLGIAFLLIGLSLAYLMVAFWPRTIEKSTVVAPAAAGQANAVEKVKVWDEDTYILWFPSLPLDPDVRLLILVLLAGALGSYVHAAQSFASYVGNAKFKASWTWWYVLRIPMGAALAMFVYFAVRGGLLAAGTATGSGAANDLNLFGIMSFSALAGLFSKQAADKLAEVFDTLFATKEDRREDKLSENPQPELASVTPDPLPASVATEITLAGEGFIKDSVVKAAGKQLKSRFETSQALKAQLPATDSGEIEITVVNPEPGGGESSPVKVKVKEAGGGGGGGGDLATVTPITRDANTAEPAPAPQ